VIFGYLELAKNSVTKPDMVKKHLDKIDEAVNRMTRMIRQVTTVSNRMHVALGRVDSTKLIESALARFRNEQKLPITFEVHNEAHDAAVMANPELFEDAVEKLLLNAWESYGSHPAGPVTVTVESRLADRDGRPVVEFRISDRGNGLD